MNENSGYFLTIEEFLFNCSIGQIYFYKFFLPEPSQHWAVSASIWNNSSAFNLFIALLQSPSSGLGPSMGFCTAEASHAGNPDHGNRSSQLGPRSTECSMSADGVKKTRIMLSPAVTNQPAYTSTGVMHQWELGIAGSFHSCKKPLKVRKVKNWLS